MSRLLEWAWVLLVALTLVFALTFFKTGQAWAHDGQAHYDEASPEMQAFYKNAKLTTEAAIKFGFTSCCAKADVVRTQFRATQNKPYRDQWFWLDQSANTWREVNPLIIKWNEHAPDGRPTLFVVGVPVCFFPPKPDGG